MGRRRLVKRIYIPMPDEHARHALLKHTLQGQPNKLRAADFARLVAATEGYSASDLAALCREAAMQPLRCTCQPPKLTGTTACPVLEACINKLAMYHAPDPTVHTTNFEVLAATPTTGAGYE